MGLPKYIINFDELIKRLGNDIENIVRDYLSNNINTDCIDNINALLDIIKDKLPENKYIGITKKIKEILIFKHNGVFKIDGKLMHIPAIKKDYKEYFIFEKNIYITGISCDMTGWKKDDRIDLIVNKNKIIDNKTIKEIGEHIYFNTYFSVNANTPIFFIFKNLSGNSRQIGIDLEYIKGDIETLNPPLPKPTVKDIPNDWDWAFELNWESDSSTDLDIHGILNDGTHVCFMNKSANGLYLNFDTLEHMSNTNSEILSIKGNYSKTLCIAIDNYNHVPLKDSYTLTVYRKIGRKITEIICYKTKNFGIIATLDLKTSILKMEGVKVNE